MAQTAREMSAQNEAHAKNTIAEIAQLLQAAAEAPRAAAEIVSQMTSRDEQRLSAWTQSLTDMSEGWACERAQTLARNAAVS